MANLFDYLEWRGDLTFEQAPFNHVDNLILSCLGYVVLDELVSGFDCGYTTTVAEAAALFVQLPEAVKNRALSASFAAKRRELKSWGVVFTDGCKRHLITAQEAKLMRQNGKRPAAGAVLTPLAKEILEGTE